MARKPAPMPFIDLGAHHKPLRKRMLEKAAEIIDASQFILGPEVAAFEQEFAAYCGAAQAIGVSNGADALRLVLEAYGIGPGHEVIVPSFTFAATAFAVSHAGATPVFADIDPVTFTIDPASVKAKLSVRTKAVIPVHLFGHPADMEPLLSLARDHALRVIEDAAQAHGARTGGRRVGSIGDAACFSFYPSKNLGALGDGGAITTNDAALAAKLRKLRNCGQSDKYTHEFVGANNRLDNLQAAFLRLKLERLDASNARRRKVAAQYDRLLDGMKELRVPLARPGVEHAYHLYTVRSPKRDALRDRLTAAGVPCGVYYPVPVHLQPCYRGLGRREGDCPVSEQAAREVLSLPIHPELTPAQVRRVVTALKKR